MLSAGETSLFLDEMVTSLCRLAACLLLNSWSQAGFLTPSLAELTSDLEPDDVDDSFMLDRWPKPPDISMVEDVIEDFWLGLSLCVDVVFSMREDLDPGRSIVDLSKIDFGLWSGLAATSSFMASHLVK